MRRTVVSGGRGVLLASVAVGALLTQSGLGARADTLVTFFNEDPNPAGYGTLTATPNSDQARADFFANLTGVGTETFEAFPTGTTNPTIAFPGAGTATLIGAGSVQSGPSGSDQYPISGTQYYNAGTTSFDVTFSAPIAAFGFYGTDIGDVNGQVTLTLTEVGGGQRVLTVPNIIGTTGDGSALYYAFYDTAVQYTAISFGNNSGGDVFGFDDFSVGAVGQITPTINTTNGDIAPNVFSLGSPAATHDPVVFQGGILRLTGGSFANNVITAPVTISSANGTVDTSPASGGFAGTVSGPGSLTLIGTNTFSLTGNNTYAGGTFLNGGTLAVGSSTALGTGDLTFGGGTLAAGADALSLSNNAALASDGTVDSAGFALTMSDVVSGASRLTKAGDGKLTLSGANTYAGGTSILAGTLAIANAQSLGTGALVFGTDATGRTGTLQAASAGLTLATDVTLSANGAVDTQGFGLTLAGPIGGGGSLTKTGTGVLVLSGSSSYSGPTLVSDGTLLAGSTGALSPNSAFTIATGTTLDLGGYTSTVASIAGAGTVTNTGSAAATLTAGADNTSTTFSGQLTDGTASLGLVKTGFGTLTLSGTNSFSGGTFLRGGTIAIGSSTAFGTGLVALDDGTTLTSVVDGLTVGNSIVFTGVADPTVDTGPNTLTLSGDITGAGDLTKLGTGTLILTGTDSYTGATDIQVGTLLVNGVITTSPITIRGGAVLGGAGTVASFTAESGAVVAPSSTGGLTVTGAATFQPGSTFRVTVNPDGSNTKLAVGGVATLSGAQLAVLAGSGTFAAATSYTLLTAAGGVTGTFGSVNTANALALLRPSVSYGSNDVVLTLSPVDFSTIAVTPNQASTATAIQALGPGNSLYDQVIQQNQTDARQAFDSASGISNATATSTAQTATRFTTGLVIDRLWDVSGNGLSAQQVLDGFAPDRLPALVRCYGPVPDPAPAPAQTYTAWGEGFGVFGHTDARANTGSSDRSLGGFVLGIDTPLQTLIGAPWRVGVAAGYTNTQFTSSLDSGNGTVQGVYGSLYGGARYGAVDLRVGTTVGGTFVDSRRTVRFPLFVETERSSSDGVTVQSFGEVGYRIPVGSGVIEPVAGAAYLHTHQDGFREKGGVAALRVAPLDSDLGITTLGFRGEVQPFGGLPVVAHVFVGWQHSFGDITPVSTLAFEANPGNTFSITGVPIDRDALAAELALDYRATAALDIGLSYAGLIGDRAADHAVKGRVEYRF